MLRTMMKSKLHRARVTGADLNYVGSISIDENLMRRADILPNEKVQVVNINNGQRFETYVIPGGPGVIGLNGAAARLALPGDLVIIISYASYSDEEARRHEPVVLVLDEENRPLQ